MTLLRRNVFLAALALALSHAPLLGAADQAILESARECAKIMAPEGGNGAARAEAHRRQVECLKRLYVSVGAPHGSVAVVDEIHARLDALEQAYYDSRALCSIRRDAGEETGSCGTISMAPNEFLTLLKTMIINEDAGWVKEDPRLKEALRMR